MAISVRRLAQQKGLGLRIVAGGEGADRIIKWAHAIELVDPTPYLSGGELVMTTGLQIGIAEDEQFRYVAKLSEAGTVALAFDTGTTFDHVPKGVIQAGNALGLPILQVPASTPFIAITRAVIDELTADQVRGVQRIVDQQVVLARATIDGAIPGLVAALSQTIGATVVVLDNTGRLLAGHGPRPEHVVDIASKSIAGIHGRSNRRHAARVVADEDGFCTIQTLRAAREARGQLAVHTPEPLDDSSRVLLAHAVSLISIELAKPARVVDAEQRLRTAVTHALLRDVGSGDPSVLRYFGFDPDAEVVAIVLTDVGPVLGAERQVTQTLESLSLPYLMATTEDEIVTLIPAAHADRAQHIYDAVSVTDLGRPLGGGLGLPAALPHLSNSLNQARAASRASRGRERRLRRFSELSTFALLLGRLDSTELHGLASALSPLDDYDTDHDAGSPTLVPTLEAFLSHNGQVEVAAASLGIHRHTMRNRLQKISELTGSDLESAYTRADLWLAIRAREL